MITETDHCPLSGDRAAGPDPGAEFRAWLDDRLRPRGPHVAHVPPEVAPGATSLMTPEQAEAMAERLLELAGEARAARAAEYPGLYPEDAP